MTLPSHWKILITGITSIHGWPIYQQLRRLVPHAHVYGVRPPKTKEPQHTQVLAECITNKDRLQAIREAFSPTHVVHCAGVCDLDVCEERPRWAHALNVSGTLAVVEVFGDLPILYLSTDLVFSGDSPPTGGYAEEDAPDPISVAGRTFAEAETCLDTARHCIVRLGLPLGDSITGDKGAIDWIEHRFRRSLPVTLFHDEYRSCVWCEDIAHMAARALAGQWTGLYHYGGPKSWSLHEIGQHVLQRGPYNGNLLTGIHRAQEVNGPPRIGDVSLNSSRVNCLLSV